MVGEDGPQAHSARMQDCLVAQTTKTGMAVYNLDSFAYDDVAKHGEEGEDGGEGGLPVDDEEGDIIDLQPVGEVTHSCSAGICMGNDYDFMATIYELLVMGQESSAWVGECVLRWTAGTCDFLPPLCSMRRHSKSSICGSYQAEGRSCR